MKDYITELVGTFLLVLTVGLTQGNPIAIGAVLATAVYLGGHVSGGHYNPAVTLAVWLRGKLKRDKAIWYWASQLVGGFIAAAVIAWVAAEQFVPAPWATLWPSFVVEVIFTFVLAATVLTVVTSKALGKNDIYGVAIGLALLLGVYVAGPISGGVLNPAVSIGPMVFAGSYSSFWLYLLAPLIGGGLAAWFFKYLNPRG